MRQPTRRSARGFTLIELMIVVAIIGILASIAIPEFMNVGNRSRLSERDVIMRAVAKGVSDIVLNSQNAPVDLRGGYNPPGAPGTQRRTWNRALDDWGRLPVIVDGQTFCSYQFFFETATDPLIPRLWIFGTCDIDGDGNQARKYDVYDVVGTALVLNGTLSGRDGGDSVF